MNRLLGNESRWHENVVGHRADEGAEKPASRGSVVSVWGPTGAPGRTSVAIELATELALTGVSVVLVDADTYGGSVSAYLELFDETPGFLALARLAESGACDEVQRKRLIHTCALGAVRLDVLTGLVNPARWPELSHRRSTAALEYLREHYDFTIVDVGFNLEEDEEISSDLLAPRRNQATIAALRSSDLVVAVGGSDVVGLARYIHALTQLQQVVPDAQVLHVINRLRRTGALSSAASTVSSTLRRFAGLDEVVLVDEDIRAFDAAAVAGVPLCVAAPNVSSRKQLAQLAGKVLNRVGHHHRDAGAAPRRRGFSKERAAG